MDRMEHHIAQDVNVAAAIHCAINEVNVANSTLTDTSPDHNSRTSMFHCGHNTVWSKGFSGALTNPSHPVIAKQKVPTLVTKYHMIPLDASQTLVILAPPAVFSFVGYPDPGLPSGYLCCQVSCLQLPSNSGGGSMDT